jgi:hypothetical protein
VSTARDQLPSWQQFANDVLGGTTKSDYLRHAEDCFKLAAFGNELSALSMSDRIAVAAALRRLQWANSASRAGDLLAQVPVPRPHRPRCRGRHASRGAGAAAERAARRRPRCHRT